MTRSDRALFAGLWLVVVVHAIAVLQACGMASKSPDSAPKYNVRQERRDDKKLWRPCQDFEIEAKGLTPNFGWLCNRVCLKSTRLDNKCVEWKTNARNFANEADFRFFRDASMVMIQESEVL